jgi:hypothetical protein
MLLREFFNSPATTCGNEKTGEKVRDKRTVEKVL